MLSKLDLTIKDSLRVDYRMLQHFKFDSNGQKTASELYADLKFLNLLMLFKWFLRSRKHCMCSVAFQQLVVALRDHLVP